MSELKETVPESQQKQPAALRIPALILSYIFHPIFMPTLIAISLYWLTPISFAGVTQHDFFRWIGIIAFITVFFSIVTVLLMKKLGFIKSIHMDDPKDRILPLMASMIYFFWADDVFSSLPGIPMILHVLLLGSFWGIIVIFMINIFFKISMHATAAGSLIGILIVLMVTSTVNMSLPFFAALIIAGLIGTVRMILGAHKSFEIWLGYIMGILVMVGAYIFLKYMV